MSKALVCVMTSAHSVDDIRIFYKECRTLSHAGYDVIFVVPHDKDQTIDGITIKAVAKPVSRKQRFIVTGKKIYSMALKLNADIYHFHDPDLIIYAQLLRMHGKRVIYDMHENLPQDILTKDWIPPIIRVVLSGIIKRLERFLLKGFSVIFAETSYKKDYPWINKYVDVLNMPDLDYLLKLDTSKRESELRIGYIGSVGQQRGSIVTLEALSLVQKLDIDCSFHCIGPVEEQHYNILLDKMDRLSLKNVHYYGYMPPVEAWGIISSCHLGMAILMPEPNFYESYPTKLFEYMSLGIPVITSNFPLYEKVVIENGCGICVNPLNPEEVAEAIMWVINNPEQANQMGQNGRRAVKEKYNWGIEAQKLLKLYEELL